MISHDLSVLAETCERLAVMYAGRLVEIGPSRELLERPAAPVHRARWPARSRRIGDPASRLAPSGLPGDPPDPAKVGRPGCPFPPRCPVRFESARHATIEAVARRAAGVGLPAACVHVFGSGRAHERCRTSGAVLEAVDLVGHLPAGAADRRRGRSTA